MRTHTEVNFCPFTIYPHEKEPPYRFAKSEGVVLDFKELGRKLQVFLLAKESSRGWYDSITYAAADETTDVSKHLNDNSRLLESDGKGGFFYEHIRITYRMEMKRYIVCTHKMQKKAAIRSTCVLRKTI